MTSSFGNSFSDPEAAQDAGDDTETNDIRSVSSEERDQEVKNRRGKWTYHHAVVFFITFTSYCLIHATRKTFSNVKYSLVATWTPQNSSESDIFPDKVWNSHRLFRNAKDAEHFLGVLDAVFMFSYATGLYISGALGDRIDPRIVLSFGMWGTAVVNVIVGVVLERAHFYSMPLYVFLWILNGLAQSSGWPAEVCVMGNWFGRGSRGFILGVWSSCASVGNIIGSYLAASVLPYGYEYAFLVNSTLLFAFGFIVFFGLLSAPRDIGLPDTVEHLTSTTRRPSQQQINSSNNSSNNGRPYAIDFCHAILLPGVIAYSLAYAFLKLVNYSIFFWLPYYMTNNFKWPEVVADQVSTWYDWGGIVGGIIGGIISDALGKRTPVVVAQLSLFIGSLVLYLQSPNDKLINGVLMGIAGLFGNGAANLISAACSADLGRQEALRGNSEALATVTGIVDGTGSVGAALGQVIIPSLYQLISWNAVFYMFMIMIVLTIVCLSKLCWRECKEIYRSRSVQLYQPLSSDDSD